MGVQLCVVCCVYQPRNSNSTGLRGEGYRLRIVRYLYSCGKATVRGCVHPSVGLTFHPPVMLLIFSLLGAIYALY